MSLYTVRLATGVATVLSIGTILLCIIMVPTIVSEITDAWDDFDFEMQDFRVCDTFTVFSEITVLRVCLLRLKKWSKFCLRR
jgi:hypothetical protein